MDGGMICLLVVVGIVVLLVFNASDKANNKFRGKCGECAHQTGWLTESGVENAMEAHYADRHPELPPGGLIQAR